MMNEEAVAFRLALERALVSVREVENWADRVIADADTPPSWAIEVSFAATEGLGETITALSTVSGDLDKDVVWSFFRPMLLAHFVAKRTTVMETLGILEDLANGGWFSETISDCIGSLEIDHDLALIGNLPQSEVQDRLLVFLHG